MQVTLVNEGLPQWTGSTEPVDVVPVSHVLYYVPDKPSSLRPCQCSNLQFNLVNESLPGWTGPTEPVDVVMLNQVIHYIPEYVSALRQCYEWLKPGGSIIISQSYDDNIFVQMGEFVCKICSVLK